MVQFIRSYTEAFHQKLSYNNGNGNGNIKIQYFLIKKLPSIFKRESFTNKI